MTAPVSRPAAHAGRLGRLWWLPADGRGNGLDDDAWAPVLEVSQQIVPELLNVLRAAGVRPMRPRRARPAPGCGTAPGTRKAISYGLAPALTARRRRR